MIKAVKPTRENVRKFGQLFCVLAALVGVWILWRGHGGWPWAFGASAFFLLSSLIGYPLLRPVYVGWMSFAYVLGWVNTRLILGLFFFLVITPVGVVLRLMGKDLLDERVEPEVESYWIKRKDVPQDPKRAEHLY